MIRADLLSQMIGPEVDRAPVIDEDFKEIDGVAIDAEELERRNAEDLSLFESRQQLLSVPIAEVIGGELMPSIFDAVDPAVIPAPLSRWEQLIGSKRAAREVAAMCRLKRLAPYSYQDVLAVGHFEDDPGKVVSAIGSAVTSSMVLAHNNTETFAYYKNRLHSGVDVVSSTIAPYNIKTEEEAAMVERYFEVVVANTVWKHAVWLPDSGVITPKTREFIIDQSELLQAEIDESPSDDMFWDAIVAASAEGEA